MEAGREERERNVSQEKAQQFMKIIKTRDRETHTMEESRQKETDKRDTHAE